MKRTLENIPVNLQQGFFLSDGKVVAAYSHHNKIVAFHYPWGKRDFQMLDSFKDYSVIHTDGFNIEYWNNPQSQHVPL